MPRGCEGLLLLGGCGGGILGDKRNVPSRVLQAPFDLGGAVPAGRAGSRPSPTPAGPYSGD